VSPRERRKRWTESHAGRRENNSGLYVFNVKRSDVQNNSLPANGSPAQHKKSKDNSHGSSLSAWTFRVDRAHVGTH
jgi:hypothetical protein